MLDIFSTNDAFSLTSLTDSFIKMPFKPGQVGRSGLFRAGGITRTTAVVEWKDGQLSLIQTAPRGGVDKAPAGNVKSKIQSFLVPHLERNGTILADEVQNVRAFGSEDASLGVQTLVNDRLAELRADHEITLEHMRIGAIQGTVKDADGATLLDLFTAFDVSQSTGTVSPNASSDEGDALRGEIVAIQRTIEAVVGGAMPTGYRAFCGPDFFDTLRGDFGVTQTLRYADPASLLQQNAGPRVFAFGGVIWEEYRGGTAYIAADEAYVVPEGIDIFRTYYAPADFLETVNTVGLPLYARTYPDPESRYVKVHTQSNPLAITLRPDAVVKVTITT